MVDSKVFAFLLYRNLKPRPDVLVFNWKLNECHFKKPMKQYRYRKGLNALN